MLEWFITLKGRFNQQLKPLDGTLLASKFLKKRRPKRNIKGGIGRFWINGKIVAHDS